MYRFVTSELLRLRMLVEIISGFSLFPVFIIKRNHFYHSVYRFIFSDCSLQRHLLDHILFLIYCDFCSEGWDSRVLEWDWRRSWDPRCQAWSWVSWSFQTARDSYPQAQEVWHPLQTCKYRVSVLLYGLQSFQWAFRFILVIIYVRNEIIWYLELVPVTYFSGSDYYTS